MSHANRHMNHKIDIEQNIANAENDCKGRQRTDCDDSIEWGFPKIIWITLEQQRDISFGNKHLTN